MEIEDTNFSSFSFLINTYITLTNYTKNVSVTFRRCTVLEVTITMIAYPQKGFKLSVLDSLISSIFLIFQICNAPIYFPSVKVVIHNCHFKNHFAEKSVFLIALRPGPITDSHFASLSQQCPVKIKISNTIFEQTTLLLRKSVSDFPKSREKDNITFHNCTFKHSHGQIEKTNDVAIGRYVLVLRDFHFPVVMSDCNIIDNKAGAIFMSNSKLQLRGHNVIRNNKILYNDIRDFSQIDNIMVIIALICFDLLSPSS